MDFDVTRMDEMSPTLDEFFTCTIAPQISNSVDNDFLDWHQQHSQSIPSTFNGASWNLASYNEPPLDTDSSKIVVSKTSKQDLDTQLSWPNKSARRTAQTQEVKPVLSSRDSKSSLTSAETLTSTSSECHTDKSCANCRMTEAEIRRTKAERRREQNRASQRKFRARKEAKIRDAIGQVSSLETYVDFLEKHNNDLECTNGELRNKIAELEAMTSPSPPVMDGHTTELGNCSSAAIRGDTRVGRAKSATAAKITNKSSARGTRTADNSSSTDPRFRLSLSLLNHDLQPATR